MDSTDIDERPKLYFKRVFNAAPDKVWQAWVDPEALKRWFGPNEPDPVLVAETDVRVGGRYRIVFRSNGEQHEVSGVYREVDAPRKLVFTWAWKSTPERESLVIVELVALSQGTELHFRQEQFFDIEARDAHEKGWTGAFEKIARYLDSL
ncbi:SRPBCC family protein [Pararobbsia alpina]|uniref:Activator of Hsp90 ATPase homologue 1/2-like C-terminal domain-containing protein n=1 Tax=Pararobbsia alpina TaxID=621374 RepID=A0A6S7B965_9BURK|nr:SRPBCC domain-containing protein [Pararobbsia alpina]CAB3792146.1 hypothetical protein LMG28138_03276 [Pararobbsia alpina]